MAIETWDPRKRRWVLYRSEAEHTADCQAYPFEKIPRRVFLDTNVVNLLVTNAEQVFEQAPIPEDVDKTRTEDIEALMHIFHVGTRACWDLVTSQKTIDEVTLTPNISDREDLLDYALQLLQPRDDEYVFAEAFGRRLVGTSFVSALPDLADQMLIGNAVGYACDAFCTRDRRTIIKYRDNLPQLPLRILTPLEWWRCVRPWAGLFG